MTQQTDFPNDARLRPAGPTRCGSDRRDGVAGGRGGRRGGHVRHEQVVIAQRQARQRDARRRGVRQRGRAAPLLQLGRVARQAKVGGRGGAAPPGARAHNAC